MKFKIIGIGIDILENNRINNSSRLNKKIINKKEIFPIKKNVKKLLYKSFTIKESFLKALGSGLSNNIYFKSIIIKNNKLGKPFLKNRIKYTKTLISLSHEKNITIALAIIVKKL